MIDGISYIPSSALLTGIRKLSFKDDRAFAVTDTLGECPRLYAGQGSELGFYCNDTRFLGIWEMTFNGQAPISLAHELRFGGNTAVYSMTNRDFPRLGGGARIPRDTFLIRRIHALWRDTLYETIEIKNFDQHAHDLQVEQWCGGQFDDLFEVRGFARERRGRMLPPQDAAAESGWRTTVFQYEGLDAQVRATHVQRLFAAEKIRVSPTLTGHFARVRIEPKSSAFLRTVVSFDQPSDLAFHGRPFVQVPIVDQMSLLEAEHEATRSASTLRIDSDNAILNRALQNAQTDIQMLLTDEREGDGPAELYPYAGIPWFSAPFGRDGIITAYQMLPWNPRIGQGVLEYVFRTLGQKDDPFTDEQPGKVFHEMRRGEMARTREVPFIPYYGSVDATPLSLILLHEYVKWTLDGTSLRRWWPQALCALGWVRGFTRNARFLTYAKQSPNGLVNQGWKDSHDSVMHASGELALAPIALCEVQGYAYRALTSMSALARHLGDNELAQTLRREALEFRILFSERFWNPEEGIVHLALDGSGAPCAVRSSNMGHCLWAEILDTEQAAAVSDALLEDRMFSGYGVRTLAKGERAYNPLSYHNGSVWPHDNSLIMEGLRNYGMTRHLEKLSLGLLGVVETSDDFRLPELFCGFRKRENAAPVPYEVACKPQAWAAGSLFLMLKSMLGFSIGLEESHLVVNSPLLTPQMGSLELRNLRGRDWELDLLFRRSRTGTVVDVLRKHGDVRVLTVK